MEVAGGNVSLLLAVAIVVGFRWPAAWAIVLLTKITPGIGLLWFAVRGEWRSLAIALGATAAIVAVSYVTMPAAWRRWVEVIIDNAGKGGTWASVPIPLWIRLPAAVALVVWGARTDRRWTVPVASMLALPRSGTAGSRCCSPSSRSCRSEAARSGGPDRYRQRDRHPVVTPRSSCRAGGSSSSPKTLSFSSETWLHRADARLVAGRGVDEIAGVLRQRDLRRRDLVRLVGRLLEVRVDLEVDVRPAALVAGREDALEGHEPGAVGRLDAAQVVLVRGGLRVERVVAVLVAVPEVDRRALERRAAGGASWMVSLIVSGTPVAIVVEDPKLERDVLRTTPLWFRTFGPFEPSPGYGPAVSSG